MGQQPAARQRVTSVGAGARLAAPRPLLARLIPIAFVVTGCARQAPPKEVVVAPSDPAAGVPSSFGADNDDDSASAPWTVEVSDGATLRVNYRGTQIVTFHYLFWGKNFSWANPVVKNVQTKDGGTQFRGFTFDKGAGASTDAAQKGKP